MGYLADGEEGAPRRGSEYALDVSERSKEELLLLVLCD